MASAILKAMTAPGEALTECSKKFSWSFSHEKHNILYKQTIVEIAAKAEISKENLVVRFSEAVDGFPLPKGHDVSNCGNLDNEGKK